MWALTLALLLAAEPSKLKDAPEPEEPKSYGITPVQGDLSVNFGIADRNPLAGAFFIGGALGWTNEGRPALFGALGVELTYTAFASPYRISLGAQVRVGLAWAKRRGYSTTAVPDLLVFLRLTPFGGGVSSSGTNAMGMLVTSTSTYFGLRAGIGLTTLWPARTYFDNFPFFDVGGFPGELLKVLTTIVLFPLVLLNHGEIAFEYVLSPAPLTAVVFRVGAGF